MDSPFISFELTSAQVLALGTQAVSLFTFSSNPNVVRVPVRLVLSKPAGTAYTVAADARLLVYDEDSNVWFSVTPAQSSNAGTGLLNVAAASGLVTLPSQGAFKSGNTGLNIRSTGALSAGDSALKGRLYFDEVPILW